MVSSAIEVRGAFACDDIRFETGGKFILIGVYGPDLNVPAFPTIITLRIVALVNLPRGGELSFEFRLVNSDGSKIADIKGDLEAMKMAKGILLPMGPFAIHFAKPATFDLQYRSPGGNRWKTIQSWEVAAPPPTSEGSKG